MRDDLQDALAPVKWAEAQIPIFHDRLQKWNHSYPYRITLEPDHDFTDWELLVAYLEKPLDPLIICDVGSIISSVRTALNLLVSSLAKSLGKNPGSAPDFPIRKIATNFLAAVDRLEKEQWVTATEATAIKRTKAYDGGDNVLFHIATLDNLRKHERLLTVEPVLAEASLAAWGPDFQRLMQRVDDKTILYRLPKARHFSLTKSNAHVAAEVFLNEANARVGNRPALIAMRAYISRVMWLIVEFP